MTPTPSAMDALAAATTRQKVTDHLLEVELSENALLRAQVEPMRETLVSVMRQSETDLKAAHAEICKLQGIDPATHDWPAWSSPANTLRWFDELRKRFGFGEDAAIALTTPASEEPR
jgi:hypothetical protein